MIKAALPCIKATDINQQDNYFNYQTWLRTFPHQAALHAFKNLSGKRITRDIVIKQFQRYYKAPKKYTALQPFLLCMIWGHEGSGYGATRTAKYFEDDELESKIEAVLKNVNEKKIEDAFQILTGIKYLGTSFASKFLYFAAKAKPNFKNYPLIFDVRTATGLMKLYAPGSLMNLVSITPKPKWHAYHNYVKMLHNWANKYKINADKIETFLFNYGGDVVAKALPKLAPVFRRL
jgi:hypothetical protein